MKADLAEGQEHQAATLVRRRNSSRPYLRDRDGQTLAYVYFEEGRGDDRLPSAFSGIADMAGPADGFVSVENDPKRILACNGDAALV